MLKKMDTFLSEEFGFSDWFNQININRSHIRKQTFSDLFDNVLQSKICQVYWFVDIFWPSTTHFPGYVDTVSITCWMKCIMHCHQHSSSSIYMYQLCTILLYQCCSVPQNRYCYCVYHLDYVNTIQLSLYNLSFLSVYRIWSACNIRRYL